ncbi:Serine/threonine-protein kinase PK-1 [Anatilimnocola aggregata]|uniref:Serine/threonine-protein kinase PK-1 n=1 Tax=Anatilimnocola aggregata TaxID=2528021 RepID=A0A517YDI7_9BACT|nr:serine/threonine-protein kinase [Anatilimnocola aggregata]QDU28301.1 Serine/threonine-protein kinase PK-1 [Anatilimnocola aggregata]
MKPADQQPFKPLNKGDESQVSANDTADLRSDAAVTGALSSRTPAEFVGQIWEQMRAGWLQGRPFTAEQFLTPAFLAACGEEGAIDIIYGEFALAEAHGARPSVGAYLERFPLFAEGLAKQLSLHAAIALVPDELNAEQPTLRVAGTAPIVCPGTFGRYMLVAPLDSGGQSTVYRAIHPDLAKEVVLKIAREPDGALDLQHDASLAAEAKILSGLSHPNLAQVFDAGVAQGRAYLAMEYVRGCTLAQFARQRQVSPQQAATIVAKTARALALVHSRGILHLDIKPKNIVIDEQGEPRLIDFGLARQEHAWSPTAVDEGLAGTLEFMAPEQARCEAAKFGPATDIFSLGGVLYFLLTNVALFKAKSAQDSLQLAQRCEWRRELLARCAGSGRLRRCCERALARNPADRFATAAEFATALDQSAALPRRRWAAIAAAVAFVSVVTIVIWGATNFFSPQSVVAASPELRIRIWQEGIHKELSHAVPLINGDQLRLEASVPVGSRAAFCLINGQGEISLLKEYSSAETVAKVAYPDIQSAAPLTGETGTECVLVISGDLIPAAEVLQGWWVKTDSRWPALSEYSVVHITAEIVTLEQSGRDLGAAVLKRDPEDVIRVRLDRFRQILLENSLRFDGLAFSHSS